MLNGLRDRLRALARREDLHALILARDIGSIALVAIGTAWGVCLWVLELDPRLLGLALLQPRALIFAVVLLLMAGATIFWIRALRAGETRLRSLSSTCFLAASLLLLLLMPRSAAHQLGPATKVALFDRMIREACEGRYEDALADTKMIESSRRLAFFKADAGRFSRYVDASARIRAAAEFRAAYRAGTQRLDELVAQAILFGDKGQGTALRRFNRLLAQRGLRPVSLGECSRGAQAPASATESGPPG